MLHARNDYNMRIQDSMGIIPGDEPVMLFRAQDIFAPIILEIYATLVDQSHTPDFNIMRNVREHAKAMREWQRTYCRHHPDMNEEDSVYPK